MAEPRYDDTLTRTDYDRSSEFRVERRSDDFLKMAISLAVGLAIGGTVAGLAGNAGYDSVNDMSQSSTQRAEQQRAE